MPRIAIVGGGISGLAAAYELELHRRAGKPLDWHLFEASNRLGGTLSTTRLQTPEGEYILEDGPDGWVTEKPWARELAEELGLGPDLIYSNDQTRKTYILQPSPEPGAPGVAQLLPIPDRMRLMVPEDLSALEDSPLFTTAAKQAYAAEPTRAAELRAAAPAEDESVASFVLRHFGPEVLAKVAAPLLSGVFGGDVHKLSVRAVMPQFVAMEREYGSLVAALQAKALARGAKPPQPIFTSLKGGMGSLVEALVAQLPTERVHRNETAYDIDQDVVEWYVDFMAPEKRTLWRRLTSVIPYWDHLVLATPLETTRRLLHELDPHGTALMRSDFSFLSLAPREASSAILTAFTWPADLAQTFTVPAGFGFLVPATSAPSASSPQLLACTFVDQKFPHRAPPGARILRAFFGSSAAEHFANSPDDTITTQALSQLREILGPIPDPSHATVARWPHSLPQYEVGHLDRMARLEQLVATLPGLHLLGNSYYGVGIPDLIRTARATARTLAEGLN